MIKIVMIGNVEFYPNVNRIYDFIIRITYNYLYL